MSITFYGVCKKIGISAAKATPLCDQAEVEKLNDLSLALNVLTFVKKAKDDITAIGQTLSKDALAIYSSVVAGDELSAEAKIVKTLELAIEKIDKLPEAKQAKLLADRTKLQNMLSIMKEVEKKMKEAKSNLSENGLALYFAEASVSAEKSATIRIIKALENTAVKLSDSLSPEAKAKLGINDQAKIPDPVKIEVLMGQLCAKEKRRGAEEEIPKRVKERRGLTRIEPIKKFDYQAEAGAGYAGRISGENNPHVAPRTPRGAQGSSKAKIVYDTGTGSKVRGEYEFNGSYDVLGNGKLVQNHEKAGAEYVYEGEETEVSAGANYLRDRNDYPSVLNPNIYQGQQTFRLSQKISRFSLDVNEESAIGGAEVEPQAGHETYMSAEIRPGASYYLGSARLFLRGVGGYDGILSGAYGGGILGIKVRGQSQGFYSQLRGTKGKISSEIEADAGYEYRDIFNLKAMYEDIKSDMGNQKRAGARIEVKIPIMGPFYVSPFVEGYWENLRDESGAGVLGGMSLGVQSDEKVFRERQ